MSADHTVFVAITMDSDEPLRIMGFLCYGRGSVLPFGATWTHTPGWWAREPTEANIANEVHRSCPPMGGTGIRLPQPIGWRVVSQADVEAACTDRTFRDAVVDANGRGGLVHDMNKARVIHMIHVRNARTEHLGKLDRDWMRATGQGDDQAAKAIERARQALREAPVTLPVESAATVEELKALWPEGLPRR